MSRCSMAIESKWTQDQHTPLTLVGLDFSAVAEGSYLYKQPTNLPQPSLSVGILCQVSFQLSVSYADWL